MSIIINGKRGITIDGSLSISQVNGETKYYVNGKEVNINDLASEVKEDGKQLNITINIKGRIDHLDVGSCKNITINGECRHVKTNMGDIHITGDVDGDVHTNMGNIECGNVSGDARSNMGNVRYRK